MALEESGKLGNFFSYFVAILPVQIVYRIALYCIVLYCMCIA